MNSKEIEKILESLSYDVQDKIGFSLMNYVIGVSKASEEDNIPFDYIFEFIKEKADHYKCEGCKCDTCSNHCQRCLDCLKSEEPELDAIDLYASECDSYDA